MENKPVNTKATTVAELFDMITPDNVDRLMFDLYKTAHCLLDIKKKHPEQTIEIDNWEFVDDGKHDIEFKFKSKSKP